MANFNDLKDIAIYTPAGYTIKDFYELLEKLRKNYGQYIKSTPGCLDAGFIYNKFFEKFGEKFFVSFGVALGHSWLSITLATDKGELEKTIKLLTRELKKANKRYKEAIKNIYVGDGRLIKVLKKFRDQKKRIKKTLKEMGIKIKPGSKISKLLRLDNLSCV